MRPESFEELFLALLVLGDAPVQLLDIALLPGERAGGPPRLLYISLGPPSQLTLRPGP